MFELSFGPNTTQIPCVGTEASLKAALARYRDASAVIVLVSKRQLFLPCVHGIDYAKFLLYEGSDAPFADRFGRVVYGSLTAENLSRLVWGDEQVASLQYYGIEPKLKFEEMNELPDPAFFKAQLPSCRPTEHLSGMITLARIEDIIREWDCRAQGDITCLKIADILRMSDSTVSGKLNSFPYLYDMALQKGWVSPGPRPKGTSKSDKIINAINDYPREKGLTAKWLADCANTKENYVLGFLFDHPKVKAQAAAKGYGKKGLKPVIANKVKLAIFESGADPSNPLTRAKVARKSGANRKYTTQIIRENPTLKTFFPEEEFRRPTATKEDRKRVRAEIENWKGPGKLTVNAIAAIVDLDRATVLKIIFEDDGLEKLARKKGLRENRTPEETEKLLEALLKRWRPKRQGDIRIKTITKKLRSNQDTIYDILENRPDLYKIALRKGFGNLGRQLKRLAQTKALIDAWDYDASGKITLQKIADDLGCGTSTVSRLFKTHPELLAREN